MIPSKLDFNPKKRHSFPTHTDQSVCKRYSIIRGTSTCLSPGPTSLPDPPTKFELSVCLSSATYFTLRQTENDLPFKGPSELQNHALTFPEQPKLGRSRRSKAHLSTPSIFLTLFGHHYRDTFIKTSMLKYPATMSAITTRYPKRNRTAVASYHESAQFENVLRSALEDVGVLSSSMHIYGMYLRKRPANKWNRPRTPLQTDARRSRRRRRRRSLYSDHFHSCEFLLIRALSLPPGRCKT